MMMSKKSAILLILTVFLATLGALIWFYFTYTGPRPQTPIITTVDVYDPFGTGSSGGLVSSSTYSTTVEEPSGEETINKLRKISDEPIAGFVVTDSKDSKTNIRYILRANGNIYETYTNSDESKRISNTTVPKVYESNWLASADRLIIRYLKEKTESIQTFSVKINPATTTLNEFVGGIDGNFLPENITGLAVNPIGDKIFYLTGSIQGVSAYIAKPDGLNKKLIFESPLVEWSVSWPKEEIITMSTKATARLPGYLYFLNSKTGDFSKVLGDILGLTTKTNRQATAVLFSDSARDKPRLYLFNLKKWQTVTDLHQEL